MHRLRLSCRAPSLFPPLPQRGPASARARTAARASARASSPDAGLAQQLLDLAMTQQQLHSRYSAVPLSHSKTLHLIRHGEGFHNVAGRRDHDNYKDEAYADAHLTEFGWEQAKAVQAHIRAAGIRVDLVIVSPLTRALETAAGCFGQLAGPQNGNVPLMHATSAQPGVRAAHPAVGAEGSPPLLALELCREHLGVHPCDRRRPTAEVAKQFPGVDFSLIEAQDDELWQQHHRETRDEIQERGRRLLEQIMARPEQHIAVVSHSSILHFMLSTLGLDASPAIQGELHRWFENAELRTIVVTDEQASSRRPDPTRFPGFPGSVKEGPSV